MLKYSLFSMLRAADFFPAVSLLTSFSVAAQALYQTCNIPIVKKYNRFIVFLEHIVYGFPQSEMYS